MEKKFDEGAYEDAKDEGASHEEAVEAAYGKKFKAKKAKPKK